MLIVTSGADSLGTLDDKCDDQTMQLTPSQASIVTGVPTVPSSGKGIIRAFNQNIQQYDTIGIGSTLCMQHLKLMIYSCNQNKGGGQVLR